MIARALRRLAWSLFVVWAVCTLAFVLNNVVPGDATRMIAGPQATAADVSRIRAELGLDRPLADQYAIYMRRLLHAGPREGDPAFARAHSSCFSLLPGLHVDLGKSLTHRRSVATILAERLPRSIALALVAVALQLLFGVGAGVVAARKRGSNVDRLALGVTLVGISAPTFITGLALQIVLAHRWNLLPLDGFGKTFAEHVACIVMPALTLGIFGAAYYTRLVRA
jgi:peptide/nickel transport system permease protein